MKALGIHEGGSREAPREAAAILDQVRVVGFAHQTIAAQDGLPRNLCRRGRLSEALVEASSRHVTAPAMVDRRNSDTSLQPTPSGRRNKRS